MKKLLVCRSCGKNGFTIGKTIQLSGGNIYKNKNQLCKYCKALFLSDDFFNYWKEKNLTSGNKINKTLLKIYDKDKNDTLTTEDIYEVYISIETDDDYSDQNINNTMSYYLDTNKEKNYSHVGSFIKRKHRS